MKHRYGYFGCPTLPSIAVPYVCQLQQRGGLSESEGWVFSFSVVPPCTAIRRAGGAEEVGQPPSNHSLPNSIWFMNVDLNPSRFKRRAFRPNPSPSVRRTRLDTGQQARSNCCRIRTSLDSTGALSGVATPDPFCSAGRRTGGFCFSGLFR